MALFDPRNPPEGLTTDYIEGVNGVIDRLRARKVAEITTKDPVTGSTLVNLVRCYTQAHLRRSLALLDAGVAELEASRNIVAEMCTRGLYESVATFCDFTETIVPLAEAFEFQKIADLIEARAFQTRIPSFLEKNDASIKAPQILNQIDAMNKHYAGYREAYDHLSDLVHPNGLGVVVYFSQMTDGVVTFSDGGYPAERARTSLICAGFLLAYFELALHKLGAALDKLSAEATRRSAERASG